MGHAALETFLLLNGFELGASVDAGERIILDVAAGHASREDLLAWIRAHLIAAGS